MHILLFTCLKLKSSDRNNRQILYQPVTKNGGRCKALIGNSSLANLPRLRDYTSHRVSSYDPTGGNKDAWQIKPGEKRTLAEIEGPGCIKHIWMTLGIPREDYLRRIVLRFFWDNHKEPSVECPIGDFFGLGHGIRRNFVSLPLQMSPQEGKGFNTSIMNVTVPLKPSKA